MYRDELDAMKERAIRADKLESEVARYRDKLHNMNFYKTKLEVCIEEWSLHYRSNVRGRWDLLMFLKKCLNLTKGAFI